MLLVRFYQVAISPLFPPSCRFYPSCSQYSIGAIGRHGLLWGCWLTLLRLLKCHPFHPGGYDPVPDGRGSPILPRENTMTSPNSIA